MDPLQTPDPNAATKTKTVEDALTKPLFSTGDSPLKRELSFPAAQTRTDKIPVAGGKTLGKRVEIPYRNQNASVVIPETETEFRDLCGRHTLGCYLPPVSGGRGYVTVDPGALNVGFRNPKEDLVETLEHEDAHRRGAYEYGARDRQRSKANSAPNAQDDRVYRQDAYMTEVAQGPYDVRAVTLAALEMTNGQQTTQLADWLPPAGKKLFEATTDFYKYATYLNASGPGIVAELRKQDQKAYLAAEAHCKADPRCAMFAVPHQTAYQAERYFKEPWTKDELDHLLARVDRVPSIMKKPEILREVYSAVDQFYRERMLKEENSKSWYQRTTRKVSGQFDAEVRTRVEEFMRWHQQELDK